MVFGGPKFATTLGYQDKLITYKMQLQACLAFGHRMHAPLTGLKLRGGLFNVLFMYQHKKKAKHKQQANVGC